MFRNGAKEVRPFIGQPMSECWVDGMRLGLGNSYKFVDGR